MKKVVGRESRLVSTKYPQIDLIEVDIETCPWPEPRPKLTNGDPQNMFCKWGNTYVGARCCPYFNGFIDGNVNCSFPSNQDRCMYIASLIK